MTANRDFPCRETLFRKDFVIKELDNEASAVSRKLPSMTTLFTDNDEYCVRINPEYDASLMIFLDIAIDKQYHEDEIA